MSHDTFWIDMLSIPRIFPEHIYETVGVVEQNKIHSRAKQIKAVMPVPEGSRDSHLNCTPPPAPERKLPRVYTTVGQTIPCRRKDEAI